MGIRNGGWLWLRHAFKMGGGISLFIFLCGCVSHRQHRTDFSETAFENLFDAEKSPHAVLERYPEFILGHVEIDDQGQLWQKVKNNGFNQLEYLEAEFNRMELQNGAVFVVYVHGWNHGAKEGDTDLNNFRETLLELSGKDPSGRKVVGIYVSWRGKSLAGPIISRLTFWDRKKTAHRVGTGALIEVLTRLDLISREAAGRGKANSQGSRSRLFAIGHSFGGAAVFSAVRNQMVDSALRRGLDSQSGPVDGYGDLLILLNSAFEAILFDDLHRAQALHPDSMRNESQLPVLLTMGANNDLATRCAFPIGQWLGNLGERRQRTPGLDQSRKLIKAIGHYKPYFTHDLIRRRTGEIGLKLHTLPESEEGEALMMRSPQGRQFSSELKGQAFITVRSKDKIIDGHNGIWGEEFRDWLVEFILTQDQEMAVGK